MTRPEPSTLSPPPPPPGASLEDRFHYQRYLARLALDDKNLRRYKQALEAFPAHVTAYEALETEARSSNDPEVQQHVPAIRSSLSGALANWSSTYVELARAVEAAAAPESEGDEIGMIEAAARMSPTELRQRALPLLERALEISTGEQDWRFATIQAQRMGVLQSELGDLETCRIWMQRTCIYAERSGNLQQLAHASITLSELAVFERNGPEALAHVERAARALLRQVVSTADGSVEPGDLRALSR